MNKFENYLNEKIDSLTPSVTREAMRYSLLAGGKRLRPQMVFSVIEGYHLNKEISYDYAAALEMIHTYSLIHDDLPSMDNDDLRRGKPTCHKQFDEATAILAGDGLLTYAFEVLAKADLPYNALAVQILARCAGSSGMVLGQTLDMHEDNRVDYKALEDIYKYKTGCLFSAALMLGALASNKVDDKTLSTWDSIGNKIGIAFQIQDDLLDVRMDSAALGKSNSDIRNEKVTAVSLLGEEQAEKLMNELYAECDKMLSNIEDFDNCILANLLNGVKTRLK
ncbi:MAG: farnesyl diphosphate synthase [Bulleidia sp.]|nr:farnesyl diphosphate synthase [Bulleidia sp.]